MPPQTPYQPQPTPPQQPVQPQGPVQPQQPVVSSSNEYDFLMDSGKPPRRNPLAGSSSIATRIAIIGGGLVVLIIIFAIVRGLLSGGGNIPALINVAQDQQEIIHLTQVAASQNLQQQTAFSDNTNNFTANTTATISSSQAQLVAYLEANHKKVSTKTLNLKVSKTTDAQLQTAATNSGYEGVYLKLMQSQLAEYQTALRQAYQQTTGKKGKTLLSEEFNNSQLLLKQLQTSTSTPGS